MSNIWYLDLRNFNDVSFYKYLKSLPDNQINEVMNFRFKKDRMARLMGRMLLREALFETGFSKDLIEHLNRDEFNKPLIKKWMNFNISHSSDYVVLFFSTLPKIGVDIEKINEKINVDSLSQYFCFNEKNVIDNSKNKIYSFFNTWVRKEAVLKGIGKGIIDGLNEFDCSQNEININNDKWYLSRVNIDSAYICYLACNRKLINLEIREIKNINY